MLTGTEQGGYPLFHRFFETIVALAFHVDSFGAHKLHEYLFRTLRANGR